MNKDAEVIPGPGEAEVPDDTSQQADAWHGFAGTSRTRAMGLLVTTVLLGVVCLSSLAIGSRSIPLGTVVGAITDPDGSKEQLVIRDLRLPRTLVGLGVGAALAAAGVLIQALTRNPLADPGLLGVNAGAAAAIVIAITLFGVADLHGYVWFGFGGAAIASVVVYGLGTIGRGGSSPVRLALAGVIVGALLSSVISAILLLDRATLNQFRFWAVGSVSGRGWDVLSQVAPFIIVGLIVGLFIARPLNVLALGDEAAKGLGANVGRTRAAVAIAVTLLCGAATAAAGPIWFVGLVVPLAARIIVGPDVRWVLLYSIVLAPILLVGADIVGRVVARPIELQVGIMTAVLGGPVFVALVRRRKLARL